MSELPPFSELLDSIRSPAAQTADTDSPLAQALSLLFEYSPTLINVLVPKYSLHITKEEPSNLPKSYVDLVDRALKLLRGLDTATRANFIGGHPRIGEVKGLSAMSAAEQGQIVQNRTTALLVPTPPDVLARLEFLNIVYERRYPGLVYITFVNGRSRAQICDEMEKKLAAEGELPDAYEPGYLEGITPWDVTSDAWLNELDRATEDVGKIAKSRLGKLGVE